MPTPNDFSTVQFSETKVNVLEETTLPGDPQSLQAQADASSEKFVELQNHLNSSYDTPGSHPPAFANRWEGQSSNAKQTRNFDEFPALQEPVKSS